VVSRTRQCAQVQCKPCIAHFLHVSRTFVTPAMCSAAVAQIVALWASFASAIAAASVAPIQVRMAVQLVELEILIAAAPLLH
jgi:hypothetical protein